MKYVGNVVALLLSSGARRATKFVSPRQVIRATIKRTRGKVVRTGPKEIVLSICPPNATEQRFVKSCKKAGVAFPVRKIQLKFPRRH